MDGKATNMIVVSRTAIRWAEAITARGHHPCLWPSGRAAVVEGVWEIRERAMV
jgi:hypothetical protein